MMLDFKFNINGLMVNLFKNLLFLFFVRVRKERPKKTTQPLQVQRLCGDRTVVLVQHRGPVDLMCSEKTGGRRSYAREIPSMKTDNFSKGTFSSYRENGVHIVSAACSLQVCSFANISGLHDCISARFFLDMLCCCAYNLLFFLK